MDPRTLTQVLVGNKLINLDSRVAALTTSAKVQLFPDPNTGIRITDGTNDVFKCITGGADVGDVILGSATGQHVKWDKSAGKLIVNGELAANTLTGTELKATANLTVGSSNDVIRLSGDDSTYRIWVGHKTAASAPFRVTKAGVLYAVGAHVDSASSGARVRLLPDSNIGIQAIDDSGNDVFKVLVGGTDVGDVIIGSSSKYLKWDKSAAAMEVKVGGSTQYLRLYEDGSANACLDLYNTGITTYWGAVSIRSGAQSPASEPGILVFSTKSGNISGVSALMGGKLSIAKYNHSTTSYTEGNGEIRPGSGTNDLSIYSASDIELEATDYIQAKSSINLASGKVLKINSTTVLSGQMTAQTTLEGVISQLKAVGLMAA